MASVEVEERSSHETDESTRCFLGEAVQAMRERKEFTDVVFLCDGGEVEAHRMILAARSPYFRSMFLNTFKESSAKEVDFSHINKNVMLLILNYVYLNSTENISDQNVETLTKLFQVSHLFEMKRLSEKCWKLITNRINFNNWLNIWELVLLHGNDDEVSKVLHFILENLSKIVERNFFSLKYSQLMTMLEKINEYNIPVVEKFIETIIQWNKKTKEQNVDLSIFFSRIKFDFISKEFMTNLLERENELFKEEFFQLFKRNVLPTLKPSLEMRSVKETFSLKLVVKGNKRFPLKFFFFGCYRQQINQYYCYKNSGLRIFDLQNQSIRQIFNLPFRYGHGIFPIQHGSYIYIIGGIPSGVPLPVANEKTKSFFLYDWEKNKVVAKPSLLEEVKNPLTCVGENNIYVIENRNSETIIQCYSFSEKRWLDKTYPELYPVACTNVKNVTYLLCSNNNNSGYYLYRVNQLECIFHSNTPVPYVANERSSLIHINQRMITVYKDKIFVLSNKPKYSLYIYDPNTQLWDIILTSILHEVFNTSSIHCFANGNNSLMLYNEVDHSLFQFHKNNADVKKIMTVKGQLDETCNDEYDKYEKLLIFQSSFNL